jgi:hypothetical protein
MPWADCHQRLEASAITLLTYGHTILDIFNLGMA